MLAITHDTYFLMRRALREAGRQWGVELQNIFIPLFFLAVTVGAIGQISDEAFGVDNFTGFQLPVAILQATASVSIGAGMGMITDIQSGYFDKLLLTPANRASIVLGRIASDGVRGALLTALIVIVGLVIGSGMESGILGALALVVAGALFSVAYSGLNVSLAIRTGNPQAAQLGFLLFFPLLFLSPAFAPKEIFQPWLEFLATINPVTYVLEAMRSLVLEGWDFEELLYGLIAIAGIGVFSWTLTFLAMRWRTAGGT
jgi:ABC-2 type transport system permease protein